MCHCVCNLCVVLSLLVTLVHGLLASVSWGHRFGDTWLILGSVACHQTGAASCPVHRPRSSVLCFLVSPFGRCVFHPPMKNGKMPVRLHALSVVSNLNQTFSDKNSKLTKIGWCCSFL